MNNGIDSSKYFLFVLQFHIEHDNIITKERTNVLTMFQTGFLFNLQLAFDSYLRMINRQLVLLIGE